MPTETPESTPSPSPTDEATPTPMPTLGLPPSLEDVLRAILESVIERPIFELDVTKDGVIDAADAKTYAEQ